MKTILFLTFIVLTLFVNGQNVMTIDSIIKSIDVQTVKATMTNVQADNIIKNVFYPSKDLRKALVTAWGKTIYNNLVDSIYTGLDTNLVRAFILLNSDNTYLPEKLEFACRLGYERDGAPISRMDSSCIGIDMGGHMAAGTLIMKNANYGILQKNNRGVCMKVHIKSVAKCTNYNGRKPYFINYF